jgi:hypothetical protein
MRCNNILQYAVYGIVYSTVCTRCNKSSKIEIIYKRIKIEMLLRNDLKVYF